MVINYLECCAAILLILNSLTDYNNNKKKKASCSLLAHKLLHCVKWETLIHNNWMQFCSGTKRLRIQDRSHFLVSAFGIKGELT